MSGPPVPIVYKAPTGLQSSPYKPHLINNYDPRKGGQSFTPKANLDRRLQGQSSMGTTVLVDFKTFVEDLLPSLSVEDLKLPPAKEPVNLPSEPLQRAQTTLFKLFTSNSGKDKKPSKPTEDEIGDAVVKIINDLELPKGYQAALSRTKADKSDESKSKVDAALYPAGKVPSDGRPKWAHAQLYIEFKQGDTKNDPWDDRDGMSVETECLTRAAIRAQLIAYAHNTFLYQHRTALYSLLIIGREFRAARWDRSGVIVSRKVDYVEHIDEFLEFLWRFAQLDPAEQGLDPTAELMKEDAQAFQLMDYLARPDPSVDAEYMDTDESETAPVPPAAESSAMTADVPHPGTSGASGDTDDPSSDALDDNPLPPQAAYNPNRVWAHRTRSSLKAAAMPEVAPPFPVEDSDAPPADNDPDLATIEKCDDDPRVFKYVREKFRESLEPGWPRYKLRVGKEERVFLVGKPIFFSSSMFGRATRGYVAVDVKTRRFVFLKDSWRPFYAGVDPEGTYLKMFSKDPLLIVPAYLCDGDVGAQTAYTALYEGDPGRRIRDLRRRQAAQVKAAASAKGAGHKKRSREAGDLEESPQDIPAVAELAPSETEDTLRHHIHYRIVVKDVCLPFDNFRSTQELIRLIYHCIATHYWAYTTYNLLHRDISCGNVLILPRYVMVDGEETVEWRGVLTDWELAKTVPKDGTDDKARQPERTGTWQFMSVASVASQWTLPVAIADELESFFHVMLFYGVRYLPSTLPSVPDFVIEYFDTFQQIQNGRRFCSSIKETAVGSGSIVYARQDLEFVKTTGQLGNPLNALIESLLELFQARYQVIKHEEAVKKTLKAQEATLPSSSARRGKTLKKSDLVQPWMVDPSRPAPTARHPDANRRLLKPPSPIIVERAALLNTHDEVLQLFGLMETLDEDEWEDTDVVGKDQLVGYEPRPKFCMVVEAGTANRARGTTGTGSRASKRAKTESSTSVFDAVVLADKFESSPAVVTTGSKKGKGRA